MPNFVELEVGKGEKKEIFTVNLDFVTKIVPDDRRKKKKSKETLICLMDTCELIPSSYEKVIAAINKLTAQQGGQPIPRIIINPDD